MTRLLGHARRSLNGRGTVCLSSSWDETIRFSGLSSGVAVRLFRSHTKGTEEHCGVGKQGAGLTPGRHELHVTQILKV